VRTNNARSEWGAAALVAVSIAMAIFGAFEFGNRFNRLHAILVALIFLLGLTGVYSLSKNETALVSLSETGRNWSTATLVAIGGALAIPVAILLGFGFNLGEATVVLLILLLGLAGVYGLSRK
jgi:hypothetical protein